MDSESNRIKLEHSYASIAETLTRTKVEEDDVIVIKYEVLGETDANGVDEYFDLDVPSVAQRFKSYSPSNSATLLSEVSDEECEFNSHRNHLELEDNSNIINKINLSVPVNDSSDTDAKEILECHQNDEKMKTKENICRFCLKMCCNFKTIDGDIKGVADVLLPAIDLAAIREPVMCTHCEEILFLSFDFKARCLYTHDYLIPFASKEDDGIKLNLKDIYMTKNKNNIRVLEDQDICGFCMCPVKNRSAIFLDVGERDVMLLRKTLKQCLPELDLSIIEQPVICAPCHVSLENHSRFVTNVLIVEEKIKKYKEFLDINSKSQIDLSSSAQFILSEEVDGGGANIIKLEKTFCDHDESVGKDVQLNSNVMNIEHLKCNNERKFTQTNMLDCKIEGNEIGGIKREDTSCAEDGTEFKENIAELEDQKILLDEEIEIKTDVVDFTSFEDGIVMAQLSAGLNGQQECSILPNFEDNLLGLHIDQTAINKNATKITPYLNECGPSENKRLLNTHLVKHNARSDMIICKCLNCSFKANCKESLKNHSLRHKDLFEYLIYKCHSCKYQTKHKSFLKRHSLEHKNRKVTIYKCDSCLYQTKHKPQLKRHLLKHKNSSKSTMHKCDSCAYQIISKGTFKTHLLKHKNPSEVTMHKCDSCAYQTICKSALKRHVLKHKNISEVTMYNCNSCSYQTKLKVNLPSHLLKHKNPSEVTMHKCDSCAYQTLHTSALKTHVLKHKDISEVTMYNCYSCSYQTKYKTNLQRHLLKHKNPSEVAMHKCGLCVFQTIHKSYLKTHVLKHKNPSEVAMHKCGLCAYQTIHKSYLKTHLLKHKNPSEVAMHKCGLCAYQTIHKSYLKTHVLKHKNPSEVTIHKCDSCAYQTVVKGYLTKHALKHKNPSKVAMHTCGFCAYQTIHKSYLKTHVLKHKNPSEVAMHKCGLCAYQTIHKSYLKRHVLKHKNPSEVTIHKCDSCAYQTVVKGNLTQHVLKHKNPSEVTMYNCYSCTFQTRHKSSIKTHLLKHKNPSEVHKCDLCTYETIDKRNLKRHVLKHKVFQK